MNPNYDKEDSDAFADAIKKIYELGGMSPEEAHGCTDDLCPECKDEVSEMKKQNIIHATKAHNNVQHLHEFIAKVSGGNASVQMRCGAFAMILLEGFQDLVDDKTHVQSPTLRSVVAAYVAQMVAQHAKSVIEGINNGSDHQSIVALNEITDSMRPRTDEELKEMEGK